MKIAVITTHPIQYQAPWFRALGSEAGVDLTVYFTYVPDPVAQGTGFQVPFFWDVPVTEGYRWKLLPNTGLPNSDGGFFSNRTPSIYSVLRRERPDAVIILGWQVFSLLQALAACVVMGIPRLIRGESNGMKKRPAWKRLFHRILFSLYDGFLVIGKANRMFYLDNGVPQGKIFYCRYFVDNQRFQSQFSADFPLRQNLRSQWGIPQNAFCFLFAGKLSPKKRVEDLLRALKIAVDRYPSIHLMIVGSGPLLGRISAFVKSHRLPVTFAGFLNQTEITRAYAVADCLVLPSDAGETWGLVVNETMACGLPAIVSDRVGCHLDLIREGETGFVFPCGDVESLAAKMLLLTEGKYNARVMGAAARRLVADYSVANAVTGTLEAVNAILAHRRG